KLSVGRPGKRPSSSALAGLARCAPGSRHLEVPISKIEIKRVLVTGNLGCVGSTLTQQLLSQGVAVFGADCINEETRTYAEKIIELETQKSLARNTGAKFSFRKLDIRSSAFRRIVQKFQPDVVFHVAGRVSDRASLENPIEFIHSN